MDFNLLRRRTAEVDEQHRAAMATIDDDLAEAHFSADPVLAASRRGFLRRVTGAAVAVGAASVPMASMLSSAGAQEAEDDQSVGDGELGTWCDADEPPDLDGDDIEIVVFAETVERAAVAVYLAAEEDLQLSAAVLDSVRTFARHHEEHADALNCLVGGDRREPNPALAEAFLPQLDGASEEEAVQAFYELENGAAATYLAALGDLASQQAAGAASQILPVESQHAVVWGEQLGLDITDYVPTYQTDEDALDPEAFPVDGPDAAGDADDGGDAGDGGDDDGEEAQ